MIHGLLADDIRSCGADRGSQSERSEDIVCGIAADIVHAQRGFRRRVSGDFVIRFAQRKPLPIDWEELCPASIGNDIRALPDQPSLSYVSFGLASDIRSCGADGGTRAQVYP